MAIIVKNKDTTNIVDYEKLESYPEYSNIIEETQNELLALKNSLDKDDNEFDNTNFFV